MKTASIIEHCPLQVVAVDVLSLSVRLDPSYSGCTKISRDLQRMPQNTQSLVNLRIAVDVTVELVANCFGVCYGQVMLAT